MPIPARTVRIFLLALTLVLGPTGVVAKPPSLDVKPGLWRKAVKMQTGGRTRMDAAIDTCLTAADLELSRTAARLAQAPSCTVLLQELSPTRMNVVLQCKQGLARSVTEVRSPEAFVVSAAIVPAGGGDETRTTEQWTFVQASCTTKAAN